MPTTSFVNAPGTAYTFYNKDALGNIIICNEFPLDLYLARVNTGNTFEQIEKQLNGCSEVVLTRFISYATLSGLWPFSNEIRPFSYYDYLKITKTRNLNGLENGKIVKLKFNRGILGINYVPE